MSPNECSGRTLAFLGDAVWSLLVRETLIQNGQGKGSQLQKLSIAFVSAKAQARIYSTLHEEGFFTEEEEEVYRRGRNATGGAVPNHTDVQTYRMSTGFEAILGMLRLNGEDERIQKIWEETGKLLGAELWHNISTGKTL